MGSLEIVLNKNYEEPQKRFHSNSKLEILLATLTFSNSKNDQRIESKHKWRWNSICRTKSGDVGRMQGTALLTTNNNSDRTPCAKSSNGKKQ